MAISLTSLNRASTPKPPRILIHGVHGVGKTTFAASAPNPVFLLTEDGLGTLDVPHFPLARTFDEVMQALGALYSEDHSFQSLVLDSVDWLEPIVWAKVCEDKDHARGAIKEALIAAGLQRYLGGNRIASGSGLLTALYRQPSSLFQLDEFGQLMGNIVNKRHAPKYLAEIWDLLTELSTSAGGTFFGAEYADQQQRPRQDIAQPCCCVHATTVPEPFWAALQEGSMIDGSLARFLVFQTDDDVPDRNKRPKPVGDVPAELIEALQEIVRGVPGHARGNIAALVEGPMIIPDPYPVPIAADAEQLFDALDEELTARQREAIGTNRSAVLARVWENTAKVALIKAVSANPQARMIRLEDAEWARLVVDRCVTTMITEAERHIAENRTQAYHQKVLRLIQGAGERGLSRNEITRRTQFLERKQREDILGALAEGGDVELEIRGTERRPAAVYRAVAA